MKRRRARLVWLIPVAVCLGGAGLWVTACNVARQLDPFDQEPFDSAAWAAARPEDRGPMARDAIRHIPPGTPEADVVSLLGNGGGIKPSEEMTDSPPPGAVRTVRYWLGGQPLLGLTIGMDDAFLWVHIGADGRVIEAVIGDGRG